MRRALLLVLVLIAAGCRHERSLVGQWSTRADVGSGTMIFRDDCTFRSIRETPIATLILDGTYEQKGGNVRLHIVKWSVPKGPKMTEQEKEATTQVFRTDSISSVIWTDDDHVRLAGQNGELTTAQRVTK